VRGAGDLDDGCDEVFPFGSGNGIARIENGDRAGLAAIVSVVCGLRGIKRLFRGGDALRRFMQGRLVVLDLNDQMGARFLGGLESFFACLAKSVGDFRFWKAAQ